MWGSVCINVTTRERGSDNDIRREAAIMSTITAKSKGGVIKVTKGVKKVYLGKGADTLRVAANAGTITIYNYDSKKDFLELTEDEDNGYYDFVGNDLIIYGNKTRLILKNMVKKRLTYRFQGGRKTTENLYELPTGLSYAKNGKKYDWTKVVASSKFSGYFDMDDYHNSLKTVDARNAKKSVTIMGNSNDNVIYTGNYGSLIRAENGNDTLYLGKGADVIRVDDWDYNFTVYNYDSSKDILEYYPHNRELNQNEDLGCSVIGNDLYVRIGSTNLVLKNKTDKKLKFRNGSKGKIENQSIFKSFMPTGTSYAKKGKQIDRTKIVANSSFSGIFNMSKSNYYNLKTFDARNTKEKIEVWGTEKNDIIYGGTYKGDDTSVFCGNGGNDIIYCGNGTNTVLGGKGNDTIYFGSGEDHVDCHSDYGHDTIYNFNAKQDYVYLGETCGDIKGVSVDGKDLVLTTGQNYDQPSHGNGSIRFKGGAVMDGIRIWGERTAQQRTLAQSVSYDSNTKTLTALAANVGGKYNLASYSSNAVKLDASTLKVKATLTGNAQGNTIIAGQAGSDIKGGKGNDKITCGSGADRIWFAKGEGKDTVLNSGKNDVAYLYGIKDITQVTAKKLSNGVMQLGIKGASDTLNISEWQASKSLATVELANHKKYTFDAKGKFKAV